MNHSRLTPTIITLLGLATLSACDSEYELDAEMYALDDASDDALDLDEPYDLETVEITDPISEGLPDELAAMPEEEVNATLTNCLIADKTLVMADNSDRGTVTLTIGPGVPWANAYDFDVTPVAFYDALGDFWIRKQGQGTLAASTAQGWYSVNTGSGGTFTFEMLATYGNPTPGWVYDNVVKFQGPGISCTQLIQLQIPNCTTVGSWSTNPWPTPYYDGANCYVATPPPGQQSFIYGNNWYVTRQNGQCAMGVFDGANCYVGSPPGGHTAFIWDGHFYFTP